MQWPGWTKMLRRRKRCRRDPCGTKPQNLSPYLPRFIRLEDRRVLDVSAAFSTATGQLDLLLSQTPDTATVSVANGNITVTDRQHHNIAIQVDGAGPGIVNASHVDAIRAHGDAAPDQSVVFESPLALPQGLVVDSRVEQFQVQGDLTRIDQSAVQVDAPLTRLGADIITIGQEIRFNGAVVLTDDVRLVGTNVTFGGTVENDASAGTSANLIVEASGLTRFRATVGVSSPLTRLETDADGRTELHGNVSVSGNTVIFADAVTLTGPVTIRDTGTTGVVFGGTIDSTANGYFDLTLAAPSGRVSLNGSIGTGAAGDQRLGSLIVQEAGGGVSFGETGTVPEVRLGGTFDVGEGNHVIGGAGIVLHGGSLGFALNADGGVRFNGSTLLETDAVIMTTTGNITFSSQSPVNSQVNLAQSLRLNAGAGGVFFNADLGGSASLRGVTVTRADAGVTFGTADSANAAGQGPVRNIRSVDPITIGSGANPIVGGIVFNAGNGDTLRIATTGDTVRLSGPIRLQSAVSISTGPVAGDIRFQAGTINSQTSENNDLLLDAGTGAVSFSNNLGDMFPLGALIVTQADAGVTFGTADVARGGDGPVTLVATRDAIDVGVAANEVAGSGILLNGGTGGLLTMTSQAGDVRLNGAVSLDSDVAIRGGRDVSFTNDAPIDSAAGEVHSLTIEAASGRVAFNEDLGRQSPLGALTVTQARDGVFFGGATTEVPGTGGLGSVETVRLDGAFNLGSGANVIGGAGIVLTGSAIAPLTLSTTDDSIRFNGALTLETNVVVATGPMGADILFTHAAAIDSGLARVGSLTLDAGSGLVQFNEDLGASRPIGGLVVRRADGGVVFGGADSEPTGPGGPAASDAGPVNILRADQPIDIGVNGNVIGGRGIVFNGGAAGVSLGTSEDNIRFNGAIRLQSDLVIDTGDGPGDVFFTSSTMIDSHDGPTATSDGERNDLFIDAGDGGVFFNANVGSVQPLDTLVIDRAAGGVSFGGADTATLGAAGPVTLVRTIGAIDLGSGVTADDTLGPVLFNGGGSKLLIQTAGANVRVNGPTVLQSDTAIGTGVGTGGVEFTSQGTVDSQVDESRSLEITADRGDVRFGGAMGVNSRLGDVILHSLQAGEFSATVAAARILQEAGGGATVFRGAIHTSHTSLPGLDLTGTGFRFDAPVLAVGNGRIIIRHSGILDINPASDIRAEGSFFESGSGSVQLAGDIATSGDEIQFASPVLITDGAAGQTLLSTVAAGRSTGANIRFGAAVEGAAAGAERLLLNAGLEGNVQFSAPVGDAVRLGAITVVQADNVRSDNRVTAGRIAQLDGQGMTSFGGAVDLSDASQAAIDLHTRAARFEGAVTTAGHGAVRLDLGVTLDLLASANFTLNGAFQQTGLAAVQTAADITTSGDSISFAGPVRLRDDVRLDTGTGSGEVRFHGTLDSDAGSARDLTIRADLGNATFSRVVGGTHPLDQLLLESAGDASFAAEVRTGSLRQSAGDGFTTFSDAVSVGSGGLHLTTRSIVIDGSIDTQREPTAGAAVLNAAEDIEIHGMLLTGAGEINVHAGDDVQIGPLGLIRTSSGAVFITAGQDQPTGGGIFMADGAVIDSGTAIVSLRANDDIVLGRVISDSRATIISAFGAILDGGDATGDNLVVSTVRLEAALGIGTAAAGSGKDASLADPVETEVGVFAAANSVAGGIHLFNRQVPVLAIGTVDGLAGFRNGGNGPIEVSNRGTLVVDQPILNFGGGDTRLRAEIPGDLIVNQPIQNTGGDGSIFLVAGGDLFIHNSLPEPPGKIENPTDPAQFFEILVSGKGVVRGEAGGKVIVDADETDYVIVRTATGQITNVAPVMTIRTIDQGGSDIDERGVGFVEVTIGDEFHLETNYHIQVDWGDGETESFPVPGTIHPNRVPGNTDPRFVSGEPEAMGERGPGIYVITHKYFAHPNPDNPAAPILIRVELRYDARREGNVAIDGNRPTTGSAAFNGIAFIDNVSNEVFTSIQDTFSVPGTGNFSFVKVVESVIVPVETRVVAAAPAIQPSVSFTASGGLRSEFRTVLVEAQSQAEYRVFLRVVDDVTGQEGKEEIDLEVDFLNDPLLLFRKRRFPNGHYRVYLEEVRTRRTRVLLDVHIFDGKVVPPNFRDGAGEKQPVAEETNG